MAEAGIPMANILQTFFERWRLGGETEGMDK